MGVTIVQLFGRDLTTSRLDAFLVLNPVVCIKAIERHRVFALEVTILRFYRNLVLYDSLQTLSDEQDHAVETLLQIGLRDNLESDLFFILAASVTPRLLLLLLVLNGRYICSDCGIPLKGWRVRHISRIKWISSLHLCRHLSFQVHLLAVLNDILQV